MYETACFDAIHEANRRNFSEDDMKAGHPSTSTRQEKGSARIRIRKVVIVAIVSYGSEHSVLATNVEKAEARHLSQIENT